MDEKDIKEIVELYKIGKLKVKEILKTNNVEIKKKGKQPLKCDFVISDYHIEKYVTTDDKTFVAISESHLKYKHNTNRHEFTKLYPEVKILSDKFLEDARQNVLKGNLTVSKKRFISKYEKEISDFLIKHKQSVLCNRSILIGKEIDILINDIFI